MSRKHLSTTFFSILQYTIKNYSIVTVVDKSGFVYRPATFTQFDSTPCIVTLTEQNPLFPSVTNIILIGCDDIESINNRTFDVAACGSFQLIEEKPNLRSFFTEEEIVSYRDYGDCLRKITFYMDDEEQRRIIAQKSRKIVIE